MATISFKCPHCASLCAFKDKYAGRVARCCSCQKRFIIPGKTDAVAEKVEEDKVKISEKPLAGFYKASLLKSLPVIFSAGSRPSLYSFIILTIIKLLTVVATIMWAKNMPKASGTAAVFIFVFMAVILYLMAILVFAVFGRIFEFIMDFIDFTTSDIDQLAPYISDRDFPLWHHMLKPFLMLFLTVLVAFLPYIIGLMVEGEKLSYISSIFHFTSNKDIIILQILFFIGIISLPSVLIHISITRDYTSCRPDKIYWPVIRAPFANLFATALICIAFYFEYIVIAAVLTGNISEILKYTLINIPAQLLILWSARTVGLLYRHYKCYFKI